MKIVLAAAALAASLACAPAAFANSASSEALTKAAAEQAKDPDRVGTKMKTAVVVKNASVSITSSVDQQKRKSNTMQIVSRSGH